MKLERIWRNRLLSLYYYVRERLSPSRLQDVHDIPIIINNFNRLTTLKELIAALCQRGYRHIYILDNASTYPPLLDYYATCPFEVIRLDANLGFKALWKSGMYKRFCHDYYVYTDSDVVPIEACPADFLDYFYQVLKAHPLARKVGFSLRIDNLPDSYRYKERVLAMEMPYYKHPVDGLYRAPIDTTFALYRPRVGLSRSRYVESYRTAYPYQAEHKPWYVDSAALTDEERYYVTHCTQKTAWSQLSVQ